MIPSSSLIQQITPDREVRAPIHTTNARRYARPIKPPTNPLFQQPLLLFESSLTHPLTIPFPLPLPSLPPEIILKAIVVESVAMSHFPKTPVTSPSSLQANNQKKGSKRKSDVDAQTKKENKESRTDFSPTTTSSSSSGDNLDYLLAAANSPLLKRQESSGM